MKKNHYCCHLQYLIKISSKSAKTERPQNLSKAITIEKGFVLECSPLKKEQLLPLHFLGPSTGGIVDDVSLSEFH